MSEDIEKLVEIFTDQSMTKESRTSVLAYARSCLDAQKELKGFDGNTLAEKTSHAKGLEPLAIN